MTMANTQQTNDNKSQCLFAVSEKQENTKRTFQMRIFCLGRVQVYFYSHVIAYIHKKFLLHNCKYKNIKLNFQPPDQAAHISVLL